MGLDLLSLVSGAGQGLAEGLAARKKRKADSLEAQRQAEYRAQQLEIAKQENVIRQHGIDQQAAGDSLVHSDRQTELELKRKELELEDAPIQGLQPFSLPGVGNVPPTARMLHLGLPYLGDRYGAEQRAGADRYQTAQRILHPEAFEGHGGSSDELSAKDKAEMQLKLINDTYGNTQLGVKPEDLDAAFDRAHARAQQMLPEVFGEYSPPPNKADVFLKGYTSQEEVNQALKTLKASDPKTYQEILQEVSQKTAGWPAKKKVMGPVR